MIEHLDEAIGPLVADFRERSEQAGRPWIVVATSDHGEMLGEQGLLGKGGFRYLLDEGVNYTNGHYQHANTETIVGHASLATGTVPAAHGMVANVWFDREQDRLAYNIEDPDHRLLTAGADVDRKTEIDPTQRAARSDGRSPANILTSTFGDELAVHFGGR